MTADSNPTPDQPPPEAAPAPGAPTPPAAPADGGDAGDAAALEKRRIAIGP